jgi:hypothetical protein
MKTLQEIIPEIEERRERLEHAYQVMRRSGRNVPVSPQELEALAEACSLRPAIAKPPLAAAPRTVVPEHTWIRC